MQNLSTQDAKTDDDYPPVKGVFLDIGYGPYELGAGAGLRYWMFSAEIWLGALSISTPNYSLRSPQGETISQNNPLPDGYVEDSYTTTVLGFDLGFHYDITPLWSVNAQVGYFSKTDTVLAKNLNDGVFYRYKHETESGMAFGAGAEYAFTDQIVMGAGYHSRRGVYLRGTYTWW